MIRHIKEERKHIKNPTAADYEYKAEEVEYVTKHGLITVSQFAAWKGIHRSTIMEEYNDGEFKHVYKQILAICEAFSERRLYEAERNASNIIFAMKNSYGWIDETKHDIDANINAPLSDEAKAYLAKATRSDEDLGFSGE